MLLLRDHKQSVERRHYAHTGLAQMWGRSRGIAVHMLRTSFDAVTFAITSGFEPHVKRRMICNSFTVLLAAAVFVLFHTPYLTLVR
jgi:hypothetical protein